MTYLYWSTKDDADRPVVILETRLISLMVSAKRYKLRASAVVASALVFVGVAAVSVSAYEPCRQVVTRAVTKVEWPHYSAATVARWKKWGQDHPNYHAPKRQPRVTTEEVQDMVNFACAMPQVMSDAPDNLLTEENYEPLAYDVDAPRPYMVQDVPLPPTTVALLNVPVGTTPVLEADAPEPQSWVLGITGVLCMGLLAWKRRESFGDETPAAF